jgi:hypothetical protein
MRTGDGFALTHQATDFFRQLNHATFHDGIVRNITGFARVGE